MKLSSRLTATQAKLRQLQLSNATPWTENYRHALFTRVGCSDFEVGLTPYAIFDMVNHDVAAPGASGGHAACHARGRPGAVCNVSEALELHQAGSVPSIPIILFFVQFSR